MKQQTEAEKKYQTNYLESLELLKIIKKALIEKHKATVKNKNINWGHVGDISYTTRELSEINENLNYKN